MICSSFQGCTTNSVNIIGIVFTVMVFGVIVEGLVGYSKWIIRTVEFVSDLFQ
ncbi:hypothetical protein [Nitrosopumilus sp.]|uniref:hypothetical protein n=1 Tax=Nitrosopumilus sp. TaxID=2024843 RepID=UPI0026041E11|nr:hypothetical protein [Nitrosopumilus sp.]